MLLARRPRRGALRPGRQHRLVVEESQLALLVAGGAQGELHPEGHHQLQTPAGEAAEAFVLFLSTRYPRRFLWGTRSPLEAAGASWRGWGRCEAALARPRVLAAAALERGATDRRGVETLVRDLAVEALRETLAAEPALASQRLWEETGTAVAGRLAGPLAASGLELRGVEIGDLLHA